MEKKNIYSDRYADVNIIEELKYVETIWHATIIPPDNYRKIFTLGVEFIENNNYRLFLSDARNEGPIAPAERNWFQKEMVPRAEKGGLRYASVIIKKEPFKKYYMNMILKWIMRNSQIDMRIFYSYDEGFEWLKTRASE